MQCRQFVLQSNVELIIREPCRKVAIKATLVLALSMECLGACSVMVCGGCSRDHDIESFQEVQNDIDKIVNEIRTDGWKVNIIYFTNILVLGILLLGWIVGLLSWAFGAALFVFWLLTPFALFWSRPIPGNAHLERAIVGASAVTIINAVIYRLLV
jgi:hypothetical protein